MAKIILTSIVLLVIFVGLVIVLDNVKIPRPEASISVSPEQSPSPTEEVITGNIRVSSPQAGDEVGLPLIIKGEARTFEAAFAYRVKNSDGKVLIESHGMTTGDAEYPAFRPFEVSVNYPDPQTPSGSVEVFEYSAKDGSEINKVIVAVVFQEVEAINVKLYIDPNNPVTTRIPKTETPIRATLDELLKRVGGGKVNSVVLNSGVLKVELSGAFDSSINEQVTKTAMQFSTVKSVSITIKP